MPRMPRFVPYGSGHLIALALLAALTLGTVRLLRAAAAWPQEARVRRAVCWGLAAVLVACAGVEQIAKVVRGEWTLEDSLPLHLCDVGLFLTIIALLDVGRAPSSGRIPRRAQRLYEFAYFWGLGGTVQALFTPVVEYAFPHWETVRFFVAHGGIVLAVLVLTFGLRLRPQPGAVRRVWLATLALAVVVFVINQLIGANYMYLAGPTPKPTVINLLGPWPGSLLPLAGLGTALILACYAPWAVLDRRARRRAAQAPSAAGR